MKTHVKPTQLRAELQSYLESGDYSAPFIVAGQTATGKSLIIDDVLTQFFGIEKTAGPLRRFNVPLQSIVDKSNSHSYLCFSILSEREMTDQMDNYLQFISTPHDLPVIIEQTFENETSLNPLVENNAVHVLDFDREEWIDWMKSCGVVAQDFIELMRTLPITQIFNPAKSHGHTGPTPRRWFEVGRLWLHFTDTVAQLGCDGRKAVAEALAK